MNHARLKELLDYDPETGHFVWRVNGRGNFQRVGARAGTIRKNGYRKIHVDGKIYMASRLATLFMTGAGREILSITSTALQVMIVGSIFGRLTIQQTARIVPSTKTKPCH